MCTRLVTLPDAVKSQFSSSVGSSVKNPQVAAFTTADANDKIKAFYLDFFTKNGRLREDGRMVHDMLLVQVKKPSESKYPWDYYNIKAVIPGDQAFRPESEGNCPLVKK